MRAWVWLLMKADNGRGPLWWSRLIERVAVATTPNDW